jgi:hypothetical protein
LEVWASKKVSSQGEYDAGHVKRMSIEREFADANSAAITGLDQASASR